MASALSEADLKRINTALSRPLRSNNCEVSYRRLAVGEVQVVGVLQVLVAVSGHCSERWQQRKRCLWRTGRGGRGSECNKRYCSDNCY